MYNPYSRYKTVMGGLQTPTTGPTFPSQEAPLANAEPEQELEEPEQKSEAERYFDQFQKLQSSPSPMMNRYKQYLNEAPQAENYRPGAYTRIAASLSGFGAGLRNPAEGAQTAQNINRMGYETAYKDYLAKGQPMKEMADIEKEDMNNKVRFLQSAQEMGLKYKDYEERVRHNTEVEQANRDKQRDWVRINGLKSRRYTPLADGGIMEYDPTTDTRRIIPARTIEQARAENMTGQLGVARKNAESNRIRALAAARNADAYGRVAGSTIEKNQRGKVPTPKAQMDARQVVLEEMMRNPNYSRFIDVDAKGIYTAKQDVGADKIDPTTNRPMGLAEYAKFNAEFKKRLGEVLTKGTGGIWTPDEDEEDIIDIDPDDDGGDQ